MTFNAEVLAVLGLVVAWLMGKRLSHTVLTTDQTIASPVEVKGQAEGER